MCVCVCGGGGGGGGSRDKAFPSAFHTGGKPWEAHPGNNITYLSDIFSNYQLQVLKCSDLNASDMGHQRRSCQNSTDSIYRQLYVAIHAYWGGGGHATRPYKVPDLIRVCVYAVCLLFQ